MIVDTYEGTFTIFWNKNYPDMRPLTIDLKAGENIEDKKREIIDSFKHGDDPKCQMYQEYHDRYSPPYKITFNLNKRT